jgi:hypothetical protein
MIWVRHVERMVEVRNEYKVLVGKPEGQRTLGRHRHRWEYNIINDVRETGWEVVGWMHLAWDRAQWRDLVNTIVNLGFRKRREIS